jgi:ribosomal RNA methyltransferase Nop2
MDGFYVAKLKKFSNAIPQTKDENQIDGDGVAAENMLVEDHTSFANGNEVTSDDENVQPQKAVKSSPKPKKEKVQANREEKGVATSHQGPKKSNKRKSQDERVKDSDESPVTPVSPPKKQKKSTAVAPNPSPSKEKTHAKNNKQSFKNVDQGSAQSPGHKGSKSPNKSPKKSKSPNKSPKPSPKNKFKSKGTAGATKHEGPKQGKKFVAK